jgi:magnesium-transporting ATPase (P-type)
VQLRPGWIAIIVYLQALFLLLVGYFNRKAAMYLTFSGMISIALDIVAIVILEFFQYQNILYPLNDDILTKILNILRKAAIILSILLRIGVLISSYPFMEPPLKKINFVLCGKTLPLNTRIKPGFLAQK